MTERTMSTVLGLAPVALMAARCGPTTQAAAP